jgi:hypothetical protein
MSSQSPASTTLKELRRQLPSCLAWGKAAIYIAPGGLVSVRKQ